MKKCVNYALSFGCFIGKSLTGIVLNATIHSHNELIAYNCGIGVLKDFRNKGIARSLLETSVFELKNSGYKKYLLDVIVTNNAAIEMYNKLNFVKKRNFKSFQKDVMIRSSNKNIIPGFMIKESNYFKSLSGEKYWDFMPCWCSSSNVIKNHGKFYLTANAFIDNIHAGYGVIDPLNGEIVQLAVNPVFRRKGVGSSLVDRLSDLSRNRTLKIYNIEANQFGVINFLQETGFYNLIDQYEMEHEI